MNSVLYISVVAIFNISCSIIIKNLNYTLFSSRISNDLENFYLENSSKYEQTISSNYKRLMNQLSIRFLKG